MNISRGIATSNKLLPLVLLLFILTATAAVLQFNGLYGQDAHEYLRLVRALEHHFRNGDSIAHSYFPINYPFISWLTSKVIWNDIVAMQFVSMVSLVVAFVYLRWSIEILNAESEYAFSYLFLFFFLSPYVFRFGLLGMSDMLCASLIIVCIYYGLKYLKFSKSIDAILFSFFAGLAIATRYAVIVLLMLPVIIILKKLLGGKNYQTLLLSAIIFSCSLIPDWVLRGRILFFNTGNHGLFIDYATNAYSWSILNFFRSYFQNPDGSQQYDYWNIAAATFNVVHPAFLFAGFIFILFVKRVDITRTEIRILEGMVLLYALFIAGLHYQNNRYLLQSFPFVLLIFYPAYVRMVKKYLKSLRARQLTFFFVGIVQLLLFGFSFQIIYAVNATEKSIADSLKSHTGQTIYTCDIVGALSSYHVDQKIVDLYFERINQVDTNSLLLFNYPYFSRHFEGQNPMVNWHSINKQYDLQIIRSYPNGWELYSIGLRKFY